jgi:hypothetical protein
MTSSLDHFFCFIGFSKRSFAGYVILSKLRNGCMKDKMTSSLDHFFLFYRIFKAELCRICNPVEIMK